LSVTANPDVGPGSGQLSNVLEQVVRERIRRRDVSCRV
jgi:hypothetical protein